MWHPRHLTLILVLLVANPMWAFAQGQDGNPGDGVGYELSGHIGNLLPNQITGVTEITPQWGLRMGFRTGGSGFVEIGGQAGKGNGAEWTNAHVSLRMDVPVENIVGMTYIGADFNYFQGAGQPKKAFGGGHVGGGLMSHIGDTIWFRADMKFNVNPGTSLYIGAGFMLRFGGGDAGGGA